MDIHFKTGINYILSLVFFNSFPNFRGSPLFSRVQWTTYILHYISIQYGYPMFETPSPGYRLKYFLKQPLNQNNQTTTLYAVFRQTDRQTDERQKYIIISCHYLVVRYKNHFSYLLMADNSWTGNIITVFSRNMKPLMWNISVKFYLDILYNKGTIGLKPFLDVSRVDNAWAQNSRLKFLSHNM